MDFVLYPLGGLFFEKSIPIVSFKILSPCQYNPLHTQSLLILLIFIFILRPCLYKSSNPKHPKIVRKHKGIKDPIYILSVPEQLELKALFDLDVMQYLL